MKPIFKPMLVALLGLVLPVEALVEYPGQAPGAAWVEAGKTLGNDILTAEFSQKGSSIVFGGLKTADGQEVAKAGTELFIITLANGYVMRASEMNATPLKMVELKADEDHPRLAQHFNGKALTSTFTSQDETVKVEWRAVLRDGSQYLRQELALSTTESVTFRSIVAMNYDVVPEGDLSISGNTTRGQVVVDSRVFCGLETPMSIMSVGNNTVEDSESWSPKSWSPTVFGPVFNIPQSITNRYGDKFSTMDGPVVKHLRKAEGPAEFTKVGPNRITFNFGSGTKRLNIVGVQLINGAGNVISEDIHSGYSGKPSNNNVYTVQVPRQGTYTLAYWVETLTEPIDSKGKIDVNATLPREQAGGKISDTTVRGTWSRKTDLRPGHTWRVSSVIGFLAPEQQRRSFLAYMEREKPVPYRTFVHYNDWYEIGIRLHDNKDPMARTSEKMWLEVLDTWKQELYTKRNTRIDGYVVDDGWDEFNSLWNFHKGFPEGFKNLDTQVRSMHAGLGTWLGPVGGYGFSKQQRLNNWNVNHPNNKISNFQLSNDEYFNAFVGRCTQMVRDYDMRYFKFDGISTKFHAKGPDNDEDAEGILNVLHALREARPDIFINTTVGTWASPFWFCHADSVWRQENDFGQMGNVGDARDKWITYRDRLVHEVFVEGAPLFPINSLMTHGTIITKNGPPHVMSKEPENCVKEIRAAFGCGSGLQEIYADRDLLNQKDGMLWDVLSENIKWLRSNADVLDDVHWVGGNPWNKETNEGSIYGWAAWNKLKCTLTLRNSSGKTQRYITSLREIFDVPPDFHGTISLSNSYKDQTNLSVLTSGPIDIDKPIAIEMKSMDVVVLEGNCRALKRDVATEGEEEAKPASGETTAPAAGEKTCKDASCGSCDAMQLFIRYGGWGLAAFMLLCIVVRLLKKK